jgi:hypothetical protein
MGFEEWKDMKRGIHERRVMDTSFSAYANTSPRYINRTFTPRY